jgi:mannose/fructose-specific phosphotransferase system component IIA
MTVEVKIGVQNTARELHIETDETSDSVAKLVADAIAATDGVLTLTDTKGKVTVVPSAKLAYVEIGRSTSGQVGFRS